MARTAESLELELLARRARRGERDALGALVERCQPRLLYFVRRLVGSEVDAQDVMQLAWIKVVRGIRGLEDPAKVISWLYRIARGEALRFAGRRQAYQAVLERETQESSVVEEALDPLHFEDAALVHVALDQLTLPHREALTLFFLEGLRVDEIAAITAAPVGTVKSRLHHARRALRRLLEHSR